MHTVSSGFCVPPFSGIFPPLCHILRYPFLTNWPEIFLKEPLAPIYTNFEGEHAPKKREFLISTFQKHF